MSNYNNTNEKANPKVFEETFDYENIGLNSANIHTILDTNSDLIYRQIYIHNNVNLEVSVYYMDGMINNQLVSDYVKNHLCRQNNLKPAAQKRMLYVQLMKAQFTMQM